MSISIAAIQEALRQAGDNVHLTLAPHSPEVATRSGRIAKWSGRFNRAANRRTMELFIESLRNRYGRQIADGLVVSAGIDRAMQCGEPLRARQVRNIVGQAEGLRAERQEFIDSIQPSVPSPVHIGCHLAREIDRSLSHGFVNQFVLKGDPACVCPMPERTFLRLLTTFNDVIEDLHRRFPRLADIEPPNLSQTDMGADNPTLDAVYDIDARTLNFAGHTHQEYLSRSRVETAVSRRTPKSPGLTGIIAHEYSHHLSLVRGSESMGWSQKLIDMLLREGFVSADTTLDPLNPVGRSFSFEVGKHVREMGMGYYAGKNMLEFVAEALAWRMAPGYGESSDIPRMPRYLEDWMHDCFPFTEDGGIPDHCVEFDPATIKVPVQAGSEIHWLGRGDPRHLPPRPALRARRLAAVAPADIHAAQGRDRR